MQPAQLRFERGALLLQRRERIEVGPIEHRLDGLEREIQLTVKQDALQTQRAALVVVAVAIRADDRRDEQADVIVVMERADADAGELSELFYRVGHRGSDRDAVHAT